jgi:hypothetical protein
MKISSKRSFVPFGLGLLGFLITGTGWLAGTSVVFAQVDPLDVNNERTTDPFSEQGGNSSNTFFDMMHRVQLGNIRTLSEFGKDQQESLGTEAEDFRTRQRAVLEQQNQLGSDGLSPSVAPGAAPETSTNP